MTEQDALMELRRRFDADTANTVYRLNGLLMERDAEIERLKAEVAQRKRVYRRLVGDGEMRTPLENLVKRVELEIGWIELWQSKLPKPDAYQGVADRLKEALNHYRQATGFSC